MILFWKFFCLVVVWFFVASLANATYPLFVVLSEAFETVFQSMDSDQDRGIDEGEFVAYFGVQSAPAEQPPELSSSGAACRTGAPEAEAPPPSTSSSSASSQQGAAVSTAPNAKTR